MVGLIDVAPKVKREFVTLQTDDGELKLPVPGASAHGIAYLFGKFPELRMLVTGKDVAVDQVMAMGAECISCIIATGMGYPDDKDQERAAGQFNIDEQRQFISAIMKATLPNGLTALITAWTGLGGLLEPGVAVQYASAPATKSSKRSTSSSAPATTKTSSGS